ncbi:lipopolysaccharide heptosyltransferase II [Candidatus Omnitrophota bacterium]
MKIYKNILVVRTDRIGDVILTSPSLKVLRRTYPEARITVLMRPFTKELLVDNPYIDEILLDDREHNPDGFFGFWRLVSLIREKNFDLAINYHTKKRTNLLCFLAGISERIGYKDKKFGFLLTKQIKDERHLGLKHEAQYCLDLLQHIGVTDFDCELHVSVTREAKEWMDRVCVENKIDADQTLIALHPGASDPAKRWPVQRFAELMEGLIERFPKARFILIGDRVCYQLVRDIVSDTKVPLINMAGVTTVGQLVALINHSVLLVSNDSGPVHIAAALNKPVVSLFTRNQPGINPERWKPLNENSRVVSVPLDEKPSFTKAREMDAEFLEVIQTEEVLAAVDSLFKL